METLTFALAMAGFAALTVTATFAAYGQYVRWLAVLVALLVAVHVGLVWAFRYEWSLAEATRNGYAGFGIFHLALIAIVLSAASPRTVARRLSLAAYAIVCLGASGAVFRYEVVAIYRVPVLACVALGTVLITRRFRQRRRAS